MKIIRLLVAVGCVFMVSCERRPDARQVDAACYRLIAGGASGWALVERQSRDFHPISQLFLRDGVFDVSTWKAEPNAVEYYFDASGLRFSPVYPDWLGTNDPVGQVAKQMTDYRSPMVVHRLRVAGACDAPVELVVEIRLESGKTENYVFERVY